MSRAQPTLEPVPPVCEHGDARTSITIASYNVHACVGIDGRQDVERVAEVIRELNADVIGLQEVDTHVEDGSPVQQLARLAELTGYDWIPGHTTLRAHGPYGNGLLSRLPARRTGLIDLRVPGREERGAIEADVALTHGSLRVVNTHLGLTGGERRRQVRILLQRLAEEPHPEVRATVLLGDINEWFGWSRTLMRLRADLGRETRGRTFPARFPLLALDRIWAQPPARLHGASTWRSALAQRASDHLPVRAVLSLPPLRAQAGAAASRPRP